MSELVVSAVRIEQTPGWRTHLQLQGLVSYIGYECVEAMRRIVAVDTGALKGSLRYDVDEASTSTHASVEFSANTFYAIFVELGTILMAAQPFVTPSMRPGVEQALRDWSPGKRRAGDSGATITAREAGMDRARRHASSTTQQKRDAANAVRQTQRST